MAEANDRLHGAGVGLRIQRNGGRLRLRGVVPDTDGTISRRYISPGVRFDVFGVRRIERLAHQIREQVADGTFDLDSWRARQPAPRDRTAGDWCQELRTDYFRRRRQTPTTLRTFQTEFGASFRKLDLDEPLTAEAILEAVFSTQPDTKTRQRVCICLGRLAKFAGVEVDLSPFVGHYSAKSVNPRSLPSVREVLEALLAIPSAVWRKAALLIFVYGLRNHELFYIEGFDGYALLLSGGKTGSRVVFPCDRELVDLHDLRSLDLPQCTGKTNGDLGHRVTTQFRRYGLPFRPYDLRHCYARELHEAGATAMFAAKMMGHSVKVHEQVYSQWWGLSSLKRQYEALGL